MVRTHELYYFPSHGSICPSGLLPNTIRVEYDFVLLFCTLVPVCFELIYCFDNKVLEFHYSAVCAVNLDLLEIFIIIYVYTYSWCVIDLFLLNRHAYSHSVSLYIISRFFFTLSTFLVFLILELFFQFSMHSAYTCTVSLFALNRLITQV